MKLFQILCGCTPKGRHTEQHDAYFGIAENLKDILPQLKEFWPDGYASMHIDSYAEIVQVDGYDICIQEKNEALQSDAQLFFINLGGYKPNDAEEYHYKMVVAAADKSVAIQKAKQTAFYKHTGFKGAESHIDDKYGIDVDDFYAIEEMLLPEIKNKYSIVLKKNDAIVIENELHIGYLKLSKIK
jgi:hypothetical protein